jgi:hypothetical protein
MRPLIVVLFLTLGAGAVPAQQAPARVIALVGDWQLNLARTHYGPGVDRRRRETFTCTADASSVQCTIRSVRSNAQGLTAQFTAPLDGSSGKVTGLADVDAVILKRVSDSEIDATFAFKGAPTFAYRAFRSDDGRSLVIVSVDPVSRVTLNSVVVYDKR